MVELEPQSALEDDVGAKAEEEADEEEEEDEMDGMPPLIEPRARRAELVVEAVDGDDDDEGDEEEDDDEGDDGLRDDELEAANDRMLEEDLEGILEGQSSDRPTTPRSRNNCCLTYLLRLLSLSNRIAGTGSAAAAKCATDFECPLSICSTLIASFLL